MSDKRTTEILEESIGSLGGQYITDTSEATPTKPRFICIQAIEDTVVSATTGNPDVDGITLLAGTMIYGRWTALTLTSGKVIAYEGV
jgi:hypothetical protein